MKKLAFILGLVLLHGSCNKDGTLDLECIRDVGISAIEAPLSIASGNPLDIICTVKNFVKTIDNSCGNDSGEFDVEMTAKFSPEYSENIDDYKEVVGRSRCTIRLDVNEEYREPPFRINTHPNEKGYYFIRAETFLKNDDDNQNNFKDIITRVQ